MISKAKFLRIVLEYWTRTLDKHKIVLKELLEEFDVNNDGVLQLNEFENLLKRIDPTIGKQEAGELFFKVRATTLLGKAVYLES